MGEDREILKEVWDGKLPICFRLSDEECSSAEPEEIYLMVSRQTYFPLVLDRVKVHFSDFVSSQLKTNELWLDYNGTPLKWYYFVGLLYDLYANNNDSTGGTTPWTLNVHFGDYPTDMMQYLNKESIESLFMSTIKEADALKHRGKVVNEMLKKDHKQLWYGVQNDKFEQFWSVNRKLMELNGQEESGGFRCIPFRLYENDRAFVQKNFEPCTDVGKKRTLGDLLEVIYGAEGYMSKNVLIQGITPSLETSVQWLSENLSYPDNFLHICVK